MDVNILRLAWKLYFPEEDEDDFNPDEDLRVMAVRSFFDFLNANRRALRLDAIRSEVVGSFHFNFNDLIELCAGTAIHDLPSALREHPSETLNCLGLAACVMRSQVYGIPASLLRRVHMRIHAVQPYVPFSAIRANMVRKLVSVRGTALRVSPVRPLVRCMSWLCATCGATIEAVRLDHARYPSLLGAAAAAAA
jgi:DNA helicase MCM8